VKDVARSMVARFQNPLLLIEWIFRLSKVGKTFYDGVDVLHSHAYDVRIRKQK